jgi:CubicO group peptidase (beta-lactamase class C family)
MRVPSLIAAAVFSVAYIALPQAPAWAEEESPCGLPATIADGWDIGAHDGVIANPERLCALTAMLDKANSPNVHAVVLVRNGVLLFEHYRKGQDERLGMSIGVIDYKPELKHDVRSISKSVVSLLVGIAIDRHLIASIDEPVYAFFPEFASLRSPEKDRILVRHLLTMELQRWLHDTSRCHC